MFSELDVIMPGEAFDGPMQMALDEALLCSASRPTLRIYRWSGHWVSFGYFQPLGEVQSLFPGISAVRRWTGGGMVDHDRDLTFSLMIPRGTEAASMPPASFYRELHRRLGAWLTRVVSSEVRLAGAGDIQAGPSCFAAPAGDDLLMSGKKILGGAQRRSAGALLYQGSLQVVDEVLFDLLAMAGSLSRSVDETVIGVDVLDEAELLSERKYRSWEWVSRR